jgi:hypothetical protein
MAGAPSKFPSRSDLPQVPEPRRLLALAACIALTLLGVVLLFSMVATVSLQATTLTSPANALAGVAVAVALLLVLVYPLWPGTLLGGDPVTGFRRWVWLRLAETALLLAVSLPFLRAAAILSGESFGRVGWILLGLSGTAVVGVLYRFAHQAGSLRLRGVALFDTLVLVFGPLVVGYFAEEFCHFPIAWGWLISPLALAREVALNGLTFQSAAFLIGVLGYIVASVIGLAVARPLARRFNEERQRELGL